MKTILEIITPIKLLAGSYSDTATTGQGCAMNVIAYLNGEPQITDQSPCVCVTVIPLMIFANDFLEDDQRQLLVPYMLRAMGSATDSEPVLIERLRHVVVLAEKMSAIAAQSAKHAAEHAAQHAGKSAQYYAQYADQHAQCAGKSAAEAAKSAEAVTTYSSEAAKSSAESAQYSAKSAQYSAKYSAKYSDKSAKSAAIQAALFEFFEAVLPVDKGSDPVVFERANALRKLSECLSVS